MENSGEYIGRLSFIIPLWVPANFNIHFSPLVRSNRLHFAQKALNNDVIF